MLKLSMTMRGLGDQPGFRVVYHGTLAEFGLTDGEVTAYLVEHRAELEEHIRNRSKKD